MVGSPNDGSRYNKMAWTGQYNQESCYIGTNSEFNMWLLEFSLKVLIRSHIEGYLGFDLSSSLLSERAAEQGAQSSFEISECSLYKQTTL